MASEYDPIYSPRFEVTVGGSTWFELSEGGPADIVVETTLDGADRFSFGLNYPFDPEYEEFRGLNWEDFSTGTEVDIAMGWGGSGTVEPLLLGHIYTINADFTPDRGPRASVSGYGLLHRMMRGTKTNSWTDATLSDVVAEVLSPYFDGGKQTVEGADLKREKFIQHNQSDYRFLRDLADTYGFRFYADRDEVYFVPRAAVGGDGASTWLGYPESLTSFSAEINEANAVDAVEVRFWDMTENTEVVGTAETDAGTGEKRVFRIPCRSKDEADRIAQHKLDTVSAATASAHGEVRGVPEITAGATVELGGLGSRFSTVYHITKATHRLGGSGYRTSFEATEVPE